MLWSPTALRRHLPDDGDDDDLRVGHHGRHGDQPLQPRLQGQPCPQLPQEGRARVDLQAAEDVQRPGDAGEDDKTGRW